MGKIKGSPKLALLETISMDQHVEASLGVEIFLDGNMETCKT